MAHFASRQGMDIETFSTRTAGLFYDELGVRSAADLYSLDREKLVALKGFGEKKADKLFAELEKSKDCELDAFLFAIGIPNIGKKTAYDLMAHFGTLEALMGATEQELVDIEDVGEIVAVVDYGVLSRMKKTAASSIVCWKPACIHRCTRRRMQAHCLKG